MINLFVTLNTRNSETTNDFSIQLQNIFLKKLKKLGNVLF
jgi:hypothetical protein